MNRGLLRGFYPGDLKQFSRMSALGGFKQPAALGPLSGSVNIFGTIATSFTLIRGTPPPGITFTLQNNQIIASGNGGASGFYQWVWKIIGIDGQSLHRGFTTTLLGATYATWSATDKGSSIVLSGGNLTAGNNGSTSDNMVRATFALDNTLVYYWESTGNSSTAEGSAIGLALGSSTLGSYLGADTASVSAGYYTDGKCYFNNAIILSSGLTPNGTRQGHWYDGPGGTYKIRLNGGAWQSVQSGMTGTWYVAASIGNHTAPTDITLNAGATAFTDTPPTGARVGVYQ